jgi:hypothetical protein
MEPFENNNKNLSESLINGNVPESICGKYNMEMCEQQ